MPPARTMTVGQAFTEAMKAYQEGKLAAARRLALRLAETHPEFGGAHYLLGLVAIDEGQARRAVGHLARAVAITPDQPALHFAMAQALEQAGEANEAILHYRHALARDPGHAQAHSRLGALLLRLGKTEEGIAHCRHAVAIAPRHAEAQMTLGAALLDSGKPAEALGHLHQALELRPDWPAALNNFGVCLHKLGRSEQAVTVLSAVVDMNPDRGGVRANLAAALRAAGRLGEARAEAERASRTAPRCAEAWLELGLVRQAEGHAEGAAAAFERAVAAAPSLAHAYWCAAEAYRALGRKEKATLYYTACLERDPEDRHGARLGLALVGAAETPDKAPESYVRQLFDDYADTFDDALVNTLDYRGPALIADALARGFAPLRGGKLSGLDVLDAGCGTGLAAAVLRPLARRLEGADLSPAMVAKAAGRGVYDDLAVGELVETLSARPERYDLVAAADVLVYFGDLDPVMGAAWLALKPGGAFVFTTEALEARDGTFRLGAKSRYAHSPGYVRTAAQRAGFTMPLIENAATRREAGAEVPGLVALAVKPAL
ncbi:MAG: tetratricopeptide repeat protein [Magnetospirillum sp.]|nr:tetratricopeptide repeat protein [Magnetospirillum sp.]